MFFKYKIQNTKFQVQNHVLSADSQNLKNITRAAQNAQSFFLFYVIGVGIRQTYIQTQTHASLCWSGSSNSKSRFSMRMKRVKNTIKITSTRTSRTQTHILLSRKKNLKKLCFVFYPFFSCLVLSKSHSTVSPSHNLLLLAFFRRKLAFVFPKLLKVSVFLRYHGVQKSLTPGGGGRRFVFQNKRVVRALHN